ncbi:hypothetical protein T440DRAFT_240542 [Plenodomus tracheiphilus IPT5]|uniref:Uncharacterized protein n=1 Tax=Plenodomus tracheiphilus IPT5 TaxID=1408161 RepID=A0A6A7BGU9_9PLEO|nr:hypothetical protein T440DRAFT_240542 [Plenodomus tracheiphilus IPT5]
MGNHQSKSHQNRLSKPKTNRNSPSPAPPKTDSPASLNSRCAGLGASGRQRIRDTLLSPVHADGEFTLPAKEDVTEDLNSQTSGGPAVATSRNNSRTNSRSNSMSWFGSRRGSMTKTARFAESKLSLSSNTTVDMEAAIKLLQEVKKTASPEDLAALHEVLVSGDGNTALASEQNLSRNTSLMNRSFSSLTRRRSLVQTPGMATRVPPVQGRRRTWNSWRTPQLQPEEEAKWNATYNGPTRMARLPVVDSLDEDRGIPTARAQTPSDLDYGHLGSLRLGTLMVTNGAPSPAASTGLSDHTPGAATGEDYFSASEACSDSLMMKTTRKRGHAKTQSALLPAPTLLYGEVLSPTGSIEDNFKYSLGHTSSYSQFTETKRTTDPTRALQVNTAATVGSAQIADQFAQSYLVDLPDSPFIASRQDIRGLDLELEDTQCSVDESAHTNQHTVDELDANVESSLAGLSATATHVPVPPKDEGRADHRPSPKTYDSGYSSGGSFRAFIRPDPDEALPALSAQRSDLKECTNSHRRYMLRSILSRSSAHSADLEQLQDSQVRQRPQHLTLLDTSARPSSSDATLSPETSYSVSSRASFDSTSSKNTKRSYRRRPSQAEVPVVQSCQPIPEGTIPGVPDHVRAKFIRRLSNTPGMECLTNTYQTKDDVLASHPVVSTSVDAVPVPSQCVDQALVTERQTNQLAYAEFHQITELEPERPPIPPAHDHRRSRSLFRRNTTGAEKEPAHAALSIVDLGTIAASLGTSPYDIAMTGPRREFVTSPTHPHQLGTGLPRAKSMVRMDSEAAAEFARMRSKDRMTVELDAWHQPQRPQQQQRRRSYHSSIDAGEAKASKRRPRSFVCDIPPVPSIDTSRHTIQQYTAISNRDMESQKVLTSAMSLNAETRERRQTVAQSVGGAVHQNQTLPQQTMDWEAHAKSWRQRRNSIGEGLRTQYGLPDTSPLTVNTRILSQTTCDDVESWGRFSGGLGYGYEGRGVGVGGSAGTRQLNSSVSSKSMRWRVQHGVDLSDVPIMLQRV